MFSHAVCAFVKGKLREGVQGQKSLKHNFRITGDPNGLPSGSTFWLGSEVPDPYGYLCFFVCLKTPDGPQLRASIIYLQYLQKSENAKKIKNGKLGPKPEFFKNKQ